MNATTEALEATAFMTGEDHVMAGQLSMDDELRRSEVMNASPTLHDRFVNSGVGQFVAKGLILVTGLGAGELAVPAIASADHSPTAHVSSHAWTHLGGDPLVRGGLHNRGDLKRLMLSSKGVTAMGADGLNSSQIRAAQTAVRQNKETDCKLNVGDHFVSMAFGQFAESENDVTFGDTSNNHAPAYCLKVVVNGREIDMKIPKKCANIAIQRELAIKHRKPAHKPVAKKPTPATTPTAPCAGNTTNVEVNSTGAQAGNCSVNTPTTICSPVASPNSIVCSTEVPPTPPTPPVTPPAQEFPPVIAMENMPTEGGFIGDTQQFCAEANSVPTSDGVTVTFTDKYNMPLTGTYADPNGDPNSYCTTETFTSVVPDEQVFATAVDKVHTDKSASASTNPFAIRQSTGF